MNENVLGINLDMHLAKIKAQKEQLDRVLKPLQVFNETLCEYLEQTKNSSEWMRNCKDMEQWGLFGWTLPPQATLNELYVDPVSKELADEMMLQYCTVESVEYIISVISGTDGCEIARFNEACDCYRHSFYYACACILFSLIDGAMSSFDGLRYGNKSINYYRSLKEQCCEREKVIEMYANTVACLGEMFKRVDGKKDVPIVIINRNLLIHGRWGREVTRKDCVQLLLLYWHVLVMVWQFTNNIGIE